VAEQEDLLVRFGCLVAGGEHGLGAVAAGECVGGVGAGDLETELWDLVEARLRRDHDLALSITIGGTSKLVDRIQNAGWCERSPSLNDGRSSTIRLTRSGRRLLTAARRTFTDEVGMRLGEPLSTSELQRFAATVHRLRAHVHEQRRSA
jgi:hypothetical protein